MLKTKYYYVYKALAYPIDWDTFSPYHREEAMLTTEDNKIDKEN